MKIFGNRQGQMTPEIDRLVRSAGVDRAALRALPDRETSMANLVPGAPQRYRAGLARKLSVGGLICRAGQIRTYHLCAWIGLGTVGKVLRPDGGRR